jgi:hypothetical protein
MELAWSETALNPFVRHHSIITSNSRFATPQHRAQAPCTC